MNAVFSEERFEEQASVRFFDCSRIAPEAWANGAGTTRTIARGMDGAWRVSLAELSGAAKFSQFAGFDRTLTLLDDETVDLHSQDGQLNARAGQPVHFSGDLHVWVTLPARPVNVLNVMTRRDTCGSRVSVATHSARITSASSQILFCVAGQWSIESALLRDVSLRPLTGIWLDGLHEDIDMKPYGPGAQLVSIAIDHVRHG